MDGKDESRKDGGVVADDKDDGSFAVNGAEKADKPENSLTSASGVQDVTFDCPVCLQNASFAVQLPCTHIFCFLCVKGFSQRDKRCALCRKEIPNSFFYDPKLLCNEEIKEKSLRIFDEGYQWFYEGRNGWWQYEERTSVELERRYKNGDKMFDLLIAGFLYVIDLENMRQYRRQDPSRRRRIRRDLRNIPGIKGIAGLKYSEWQPVRPSGDGGEGSSVSPGPTVATSNMMMPPTPVDSGTSEDSYLTPPAPNNTPQTPMTPADSQPGSLSGSQEDLHTNLQMLQLNPDILPGCSSAHPPRDGHHASDPNNLRGAGRSPPGLAYNEDEDSHGDTSYGDDHSGRPYPYVRAESNPSHDDFFEDSGSNYRGLDNLDKSDNEERDEDENDKEEDPEKEPETDQQRPSPSTSHTVSGKLETCL